MVFGREDLGAANRPHLKMAARTWPSLYQLLPAWAAAVDGSGHLRPGDKQFVWPGAWEEDYEGIQSDLLRRARDTQILLARPLSHLVPTVQTLTIMSSTHETPVSVPYGHDGYLHEYTEAPGDSLVPEAITRKHIEGTGGSFGEIWSRRGLYEHYLLCDDNAVETKIGNFLEETAWGVP